MVKQERYPGKISGFFHQVEAECDAEDKGCHHQGKVEDVGQYIADQGDEKRVNMDCVHSGAQKRACRCQNGGPDSGNDACEDHGEQEEGQDDSKCHQLSLYRGKRGPVKFGKGAARVFFCCQNAVQQRVNEVCFFFGRSHGLSICDRLLRKAFSDGFIEQAVILFPDGGHGNNRNPQPSGERFRIDGNALSARYIHHVQDENGGDVGPDEVSQYVKASF